MQIFLPLEYIARALLPLTSPQRRLLPGLFCPFPVLYPGLLGLAFCRQHLKNRFSEAQEAVINDGYAKGFYARSRCFATGLNAQGLKGYYACSKCYETGLTAKGLCPDCLNTGRATKGRRRANIPKVGGTHGKGLKRGPRKDRDGPSGSGMGGGSMNTAKALLVS
ncbi:hypothetical protein B0T20DRAFT_392430 [Sordaria brevicollis]|uniref:Uncharacterized protein n=1 Tax=Sordaria brevicollis TaxID=83679 RepID=A0AAE0UD61_SORBR|nr:hypothetical protein B0T20DRAFT_392430 [Sordaria brevicollis]